MRHDYWITACVTWHDMTVWHEYWISDICDMSLHGSVKLILNIRHLLHDMTVWYDYWIPDICDISLSDITEWHEYWISDICFLIWLCDMRIKLKVIVTWHLCVIWLLINRLLSHDVTWLCDMSTVYQTFETWHYMSVCHVYWISDIFLYDMSCVCLMITNIRHLCHDMTLWYAFRLSDICDMTCLCDVNTNYQKSVIWHGCMAFVLNISFFMWNDISWLCDFSTLYKTFVNWYDSLTWVLNIRYLWHDMTVWHEYWISDICDMTLLRGMCTEYQIFVT